MLQGIYKEFELQLTQSPKQSPRKRLANLFLQKPKWNPIDSSHIHSVKAALHVSTAPTDLICHEEEQRRVLEFCKTCIEQKKAGSLYVCGCPCTGKSLVMERVKELLVGWAKDVSDFYFDGDKAIVSSFCLLFASLRGERSFSFYPIFGSHGKERETMSFLFLPVFTI